MTVPREPSFYPVERPASPSLAPELVLCYHQGMPDKPTQKTVDFDATPPARPAPAPVVQPRYASDDEPTAAEIVARLEAWPTDPTTGKPTTSLAEEALYAVGKALVEGKNGYVQKAEDLLEALALRNGRTSGEDIAPGPMREDGDLQQTIEDVIRAMDERVAGRGR